MQGKAKRIFRDTSGKDSTKCVHIAVGKPAGNQGNSLALHGDQAMTPEVDGPEKMGHPKVKAFDLEPLERGLL